MAIRSITMNPKKVYWNFATATKLVFMKYYYNFSSRLESEVHLFIATGFRLFDELTKILLAIKGLCVIIKKTKITDLWFLINHPQHRTKNVLKIFQFQIINCLFCNMYFGLEYIRPDYWNSLRSIAGCNQSNIFMSDWTYRVDIQHVNRQLVSCQVPVSYTHLTLPTILLV